MDGLNLKQYKFRIFTAIIIAAAIINPDYFFMICGKIISVFSPVFVGMTLAFILNRPVCKIYDIYQKINEKRQKKYSKHTYSFYTRAKTGIVSKTRQQSLIWLISVISGYLILFIIIAGIVRIIVPQLIDSIKTLYSNADVYKEKYLYYYRILESKDTLGIITSLKGSMQKLASSLPDIISNIYEKTTGFITIMANLAIGLVVSVYILADKDRICNTTRKIFKAFSSDEVYEKAGSYYRMIYNVFSQFVSGQISEAVILGVLCFIGMVLLRFEYAVLISTIIGITALIPVVGAIIGTIPCAFLLFLDKPISAVWFVIFIIVLQQLENSLIYPRVVGKSMGLPPLPVLVAILAGAKLGGAIGILLAVPLTAVIFGFIKEKLNEKQSEK